MVVLFVLKDSRGKIILKSSTVIIVVSVEKMYFIIRSMKKWVQLIINYILEISLPLNHKLKEMHSFLMRFWERVLNQHQENITRTKTHPHHPQKTLFSVTGIEYDISKALPLLGFFFFSTLKALIYLQIFICLMRITLWEIQPQKNACLFLQSHILWYTKWHRWKGATGATPPGVQCYSF